MKTQVNEGDNHSEEEKSYLRKRKNSEDILQLHQQLVKRQKTNDYNLMTPQKDVDKASIYIKSNRNSQTKRGFFVNDYNDGANIQ